MQIFLYTMLVLFISNSIYAGDNKENQDPNQTKRLSLSLKREPQFNNDKENAPSPGAYKKPKLTISTNLVQQPPKSRWDPLTQIIKNGSQQERRAAIKIFIKEQELLIQTNNPTTDFDQLVLWTSVMAHTRLGSCSRSKGIFLKRLKQCASRPYFSWMLYASAVSNIKDKELGQEVINHYIKKYQDNPDRAIPPLDLEILQNLLKYKNPLITSQAYQLSNQVFKLSPINHDNRRELYKILIQAPYITRQDRRSQIKEALDYFVDLGKHHYQLSIADKNFLRSLHLGIN